MSVADLSAELVDQYKVEGLIAEQRYTELYLAYDVDENRAVTLSALRPPYAGDAEFAGQFVNRARAIAQIRHPNIAQVLGVGRMPNDRPYVAQPYIDGYPLSKRLEQLAERGAPTHSVYALKLARQLAEALLLADRLDLLHYDLQPENVLLKNVALPTDDALVLLNLFVPPENRTLRVQNGLPSTQPAYFSPEQREGRRIDGSSHIYSLGVLLYQLLSGKLPSRPVSFRDVLLGRLALRPTALERERRGLAAETYELVDKALRRDPRRRHESIEAFLAALDRALTAEEALLHGSDAAAVAPRRRSLALLLPLVVLALLAAVGIVAARGLRDVTDGTIAPSPTPAAVVAPIDNTPTARAAIAGAPVAAATTQPSPSPTVQPSTTVETALTETAPTEQATTEPTQSPTVLPAASPTPSPSPTLSPTPEPPRLRVALNSVNLRSGPGIAFGRLGFLLQDEVVVVLASNGDARDFWYLVIAEDGRVGWLSESVVEPVEQGAPADVPVAATVPRPPLPTLTPTPTPSPTAPLLLTPEPTQPPDDGGDGEDGDPSPTQEPIDPTRTPPPLP